MCQKSSLTRLQARSAPEHDRRCGDVGMHRQATEKTKFGLLDVGLGFLPFCAKGVHQCACPCVASLGTSGLRSAEYSHLCAHNDSNDADDVLHDEEDVDDDGGGHDDDLDDSDGDDDDDDDQNGDGDEEWDKDVYGGDGHNDKEDFNKRFSPR